MASVSTAAPEKATIVGKYIRIPSPTSTQYFPLAKPPSFGLEYTGLYIHKGPSVGYKSMGPTPEGFLQNFHRAVMGENIPGTIAIPARNNLREGGTRKVKRQSRRKTSYRRAK